MLETIILLFAEAVLISILVLAVRNVIQITGLRRNGIRVPGKIVSVEWKSGTDGWARWAAGVHGAYRVAFRFVTEEGRIIEVVPSVLSRAKEFHQGQVVTVAYDREIPERAVIIGSDTQIDGSVVMIAFCFFLGAVIVIVVLF